MRYLVLAMLVGCVAPTLSASDEKGASDSLRVSYIRAVDRGAGELMLALAPPSRLTTVDASVIDIPVSGLATVELTIVAKVDGTSTRRCLDTSALPCMPSELAEQQVQVGSDEALVKLTSEEDASLPGISAAPGEHVIVTQSGTRWIFGDDDGVVALAPTHSTYSGVDLVRVFVLWPPGTYEASIEYRLTDSEPPSRPSFAFSYRRCVDTDLPQDPDCDAGEECMVISGGPLASEQIGYCSPIHVCSMDSVEERFLSCGTRPGFTAICVALQAGGTYCHPVCGPNYEDVPCPDGLSCVDLDGDDTPESCQPSS